ncbi:MAG: FeoB-associated Cys-rich membrane protein [Erysipelotrichaceae bacterium]|nr:FeoB-associated Cys-rich membrane protein [Erysipelotrichaceae bacterium]
MAGINMIDVIIIALVIGLLALCALSLIHDRKAGIPSCGAKSCSSCGLSCTCRLGSRKTS